MGRDEQREEREVLDSIFPEEITDVSDTEYRVTIALDVPASDAEGEEHDQPIILLRVVYPDEYPDVAPDLDIGTPPNAPKYKNLDVQDDKARLLESLRATIEENIGMAMVFTLVSTLKDSAELLISERQQATQALKDVEAAKAEEEENKKFHGTAVNAESFMVWRQKFRANLAEQDRRQQEEREAEDKKRRVPTSEKKLTGRQLWERGLAGKVEEDEDMDATDAVGKMSIETHA